MPNYMTPEGARKLSEEMARLRSERPKVVQEVADAAVFADLKDGEPINSTHGVYDTLIASRPGSVRGYLCSASFWDIGTPEDLARTDAEFTK